MVDVNRELRKLSKTWSKTEARKGGGSTVPDGEYEAELVSMEVGTSKKGRLQVAEKWKITSGKHKKEEPMAFSGLETEQNIAFFKGRCEVLGIEIPDDMEELPDALSSFVDDNKDLFTIRLRTNDGGYQNISIVGVAEEGEMEAAGQEDESQEEEQQEEEEETRSRTRNSGNSGKHKKRR